MSYACYSAACVRQCKRMNERQTLGRRQQQQHQPDDARDDHHYHHGPASRQPPPHPRASYRGVSYESGLYKWRARLYCRGQHVTLGRFATAEEAARAYDRAAWYVFKEDAVTNFGLAAAQAGSDVGVAPTPSRRTQSYLRTLASQVQAEATAKSDLRKQAVSQALECRPVDGKHNGGRNGQVDGDNADREDDKDVDNGINAAAAVDKRTVVTAAVAVFSASAQRVQASMPSTRKFLPAYNLLSQKTRLPPPPPTSC
jgi:hypothetical protein